MNFTERRGMVRFEVFRFKCVMREKTLKSARDA